VVVVFLASIPSLPIFTSPHDFPNSTLRSHVVPPTSPTLVFFFPPLFWERSFFSLFFTPHFFFLGLPSFSLFLVAGYIHRIVGLPLMLFPPCILPEKPPVTSVPFSVLLPNSSPLRRVLIVRRRFESCVSREVGHLPPRGIRFLSKNCRSFADFLFGIFFPHGCYSVACHPPLSSFFPVPDTIKLLTIAVATFFPSQSPFSRARVFTRQIVQTL